MRGENDELCIVSVRLFRVKFVETISGRSFSTLLWERGQVKSKWYVIFDNGMQKSKNDFVMICTRTYSHESTVT